MGRNNISGTVEIQQYTVYDDDFIADDALFDIAAGAILLLTGDDQLNGSTIAAAGEVRALGPVEVNGLTLADTATFVNASILTQLGAVTIGSTTSAGIPGNLAYAIVRNLPGATWNISGNANVTEDPSDSRFMNFGLLEQTSPGVFPNMDADFIDRGTVKADGYLTFGGIYTRVFGAIEGAGSVSASSIFLDGATIGVANFYAQPALIKDTVTITSAVAEFSGGLGLRPGSKLEFQGQTQTIALGPVSGAGEIDFTGTDSLYASYANGAYVTSPVWLLGDIKIVNSGSLSLIPGNVAPTSQDTISAWGKTNLRGTVEIDNLTAATWTDSAMNTAFYGDGTDDTLFDNAGVLQDAGSQGDTTFNLEVVNNGVITSGVTTPSAGVVYNGFVFDNAVSGTGTVDVGLDAVTFNASVGSGQTVVFTSTPVNYPATLSIEDVPDFAGVVTGFDQSIAADDRIVVDTSALTFQNFTLNASGDGGALNFSDGASQASVQLLGAFDPLKFHSAVSGNQTTITYG